MENKNSASEEDGSLSSNPSPTFIDKSNLTPTDSELEAVRDKAKLEE